MSLIPEPLRKTSKNNKFFNTLIMLAFICMVVALCITAGKYAYEMGYLKNPNLLEQDSSSIEAVKVEIHGGASTKDIASILKEKDLIESPVLFRIISKIKDYDGKYKEGIHELNTAMDYEAMMIELQKNVNSSNTTRFTIPEGYEFNQIVDKLAQENLIDKKRFIEIAQRGEFDYPFLKNLPKRARRLEGYLFPETYEVYTDASEEEIINKMLDQFQKEFKSEYYERAKELNMTVDEVITLASIIEREAKLDHERTLVSAVFHNRLKSKDYKLLQSCATVQYILGERKSVLSIQDTKIESPYNTYTHPGLPLGPIASPGRESIHAALYPADVDYMFFVANSDGSHIYSKTYSEHLEAMKKVN